MNLSHQASAPYRPRAEDIAGIDLYGTRQDDGSIALGSFGDPVVVPAFPQTVEVAGAVYTLEYVKENDGAWRDTAAPDDPRLRICWGIYA